jgi:hypothetical protein
MSGECKKKPEDGLFSFADNAPAIDQRSGPESDRGTLVKDTNAVSRGGDTNQSVESEDYSANSDSQIAAARGGIDRFEARRAAGFTKVDGKHVAADGLVSRRGYRKIIPEHLLETVWDREKWADRTAELADVAGKVLRGRNATIFEGRVLDPLKGRSKRSVEELAKQFGISTKRVYNIVERCSHRVMAALNAPSQRMDTKAFIAAKKELDTWAESQKCSLCGRCFALTALSACRGVFGVSEAGKPKGARHNLHSGDFSSECLRVQSLTKEYESRFSKLQAAHREWWEQVRGPQEAARWKARREAEKAELAALCAGRPDYETAQAKLARKTEYEVWENQTAVLWDFRSPHFPPRS